MWKQPSIIFLIKAAIVLSIYFFFGQSPIIHLSITKIGLDHLAKKKIGLDRSDMLNWELDFTINKKSFENQWWKSILSGLFFLKKKFIHAKHFITNVFYFIRHVI